MKKTEISSLKHTEDRLRVLLESIYDSAELLSFEGLLDQYTQCLDGQIPLLFYMCEDRWFDEPGSAEDEIGDDFLKFQYLSFSLIEGQLKRYASRQHLLDAEAKFDALGYERTKNRLCVIYHPNNSERYLSPILNLTKRIFVSYYKNCGSNDHFRKSVSLRFVREFYSKSRVTTDDRLVSYLAERLNLGVSIVRQRDEMYFHRKADLSELLSGDDYASLEESLKNSENFKRDFTTSVTRKNQTFGETEDGTHHYVVNTFTDEYLMPTEGYGQDIFKNKQKFCCFYHRKNGPISIDEIYLANVLIKTVKGQNEEEAREQLITGVYQRIGELETAISEEPLAETSALKARVHASMFEIMELAVGTTIASGAVYFESSIFEDRLMPRVFCGNIDPDFVQDCENSLDVFAEKNVGDLSNPYKEAIVDDRVVDLWHPKKSASEWCFRKRRKDKKSRSGSAQRFRESRNLNRIVGLGNRASIILPVDCGRVSCGAIEFFARSEARLTSDLPIFRLITNTLGDLRRRIYLANDRGWLTRMSYIHASRHKLENIRRKLSHMDKELEQELSATIASATQDRSGSNLMVPSTSDTIFVKAKQLLVDCTDAKFAAEVLARLHSEGLLEKLTDGGLIRLISILDTIYSNKSHSPLHIGNVSFKLSTGAGKHMDVTYRASQRIPLNLTEQICLSPIADKQTATYHYGLFLCSAQIRMQGGLAECPIIDASVTGNTRFGLNFRIPL